MGFMEINTRDQWDANVAVANGRSERLAKYNQLLRIEEVSENGENQAIVVVKHGENHESWNFGATRAIFSQSYAFFFRTHPADAWYMVWTFSCKLWGRFLASPYYMRIFVDGTDPKRMNDSNGEKWLLA